MSETTQPAISFDRVSKAFGERSVLNDISFSVAAGEALCILGRSGMGKSVALKLMIGLLKPNSGSICVQGRNIVDLDEDGLSEVRRAVGFLFQSAALFDSFSLEDNLALPLRRWKKLSKRDLHVRVQETLQQVGLQKDLNKMPVELSGGMRKRAGLARALVLEPKILLIDEPSSGLDRVTASEIDHLLLSLKGQRKTTMVIVTHDVRGARRLGDRFAVLNDGNLIAFGKPDELAQSNDKLVRDLVSESN